MIYFFADEHYGTYPGKTIYEHLSGEVKSKIRFYENDLSALEDGSWLADCELLILHVIGGTCNLAHANGNAEKFVRQYCERGGNILLLHGSSAAFWEWNWWREIVGVRWVRPGDPDEQVPSTHPIAPCEVKLIKSRHPLAKKLKAFSLPEDEIYTELEETAPIMSFMSVTLPTGTYVQCCETVTPWNGKIINFIPGHKVECTTNPTLLANIETLIDYLI